MVDFLLFMFDFSGVCNCYIDGNGYFFWIGGDDFGICYWFSVVNIGWDIELLVMFIKNFF